MQADPLQQLRDVHLPLEPSWWPPAPGWWVLALLLLAALAAAAACLLRYRRYRRPFESALRLHKQLRTALNTQQISVEEYLHSANGLLKRVFLFAQHDATSAALTGNAWLAYLDRYAPGNPFSSGPGSLLIEERFAPHVSSAGLAQLNQLQRAIDQVLTQAPDAPLTPDNSEHRDAVDD